MNYLAHAIPFLDEPYFAAATGVPDWLTVVDRRMRLRSKQVEPFLEDPDPQVVAVAGGVLQHLRDDIRFHGTRVFSELSLKLTVTARDALGGETGMRPAFLGHLLVEVLLTPRWPWKTRHGWRRITGCSKRSTRSGSSGLSAAWRAGKPTGWPC